MPAQRPHSALPARLTVPLLAVALTASVAACTKSTPVSAPTSTVVHTQTTTVSPGPSGPISTGPVTEKQVAACPFLGIDNAKSFAGIRLDRITELSQDNAVVGCRFYPLEHPNSDCDATCLANEKLPPGNVAGIELLASKYASPDAAHNGYIRIAEAGTNVQQDTIAPGNIALCYQTTVWSKDDGHDWACAFAKGSTVVVIRTVVTDPALNVVEIAQAVYPKF